MSAIRVVANLVDGGAQDFAFGLEFMERLVALERQGLTGKALVDQLITDEWGAPPDSLTITGLYPDGRRIHRVIPYD